MLWLVASFAVHKGLDPQTATTQLQAIIDLIITAVPSIMVLYHTVNTAWGLVRKLFTFFKTPKSA